MALFAIADLHLSLGEDKPMVFLQAGAIMFQDLKITGKRLLPIMIPLWCRAIFPGQ